MRSVLLPESTELATEGRHPARPPRRRWPRRLWDYVIYERNPLVQILYVGLMLGCQAVVVLETHPLLPNAYVGAHHKWLETGLFGLCLGLFIYMSRSDPGIITPTTLSMFPVYPNHPVLFPEAQFCRTCKTLKLPRSKHCRVCNRCVARFDHHCIWFNGCIGAGNYRQFLLFLVVQLALCVEVFCLCSSVFVAQSTLFIAEHGLTPDSTESYRRALHALISGNQPLGFVTAVTLMIGAVVWVFLLIQLKRIALNSTANEVFKREALREQADPDNVTGAKRLFRYLLASLPGQHQVNASLTTRTERKKLLDASWGGLFSPDLILNTAERFTRDDVDFNPYNLGGFWRNLLDALQWGNTTKVERSSKSKAKTS